MWKFPQSFYPFFEWCDMTWLGQTVRGNTYMFPFIETVHIVALTVLFGCILLLDLRILGFAVPRLSTNRLYREFQPYINWSLLAIIITGVLLFLSEAVKCFDNEAFAPKITFLVLAMVLHYTAHRKITQVEVASHPVAHKLIALVSLWWWFSVGVGGRAIGFV